MNKFSEVDTGDSLNENERYNEIHKCNELDSINDAKLFWDSLISEKSEDSRRDY